MGIIGYLVREQDLKAIKKHLVAVDKSIDTTASGINIKIPSSIKQKKLKVKNQKLIKFLEENFYV